MSWRIARIAVSWGIVSVATAFVEDATGLGVVRFLLGIAEARLGDVHQVTAEILRGRSMESVLLYYNGYNEGALLDATQRGARAFGEDAEPREGVFGTVDPAGRRGDQPPTPAPGAVGAPEIATAACPRDIRAEDI